LPGSVSTLFDSSAGSPTTKSVIMSPSKFSSHPSVYCLQLHLVPPFSMK
jgi:hypothetical protein